MRMGTVISAVFFAACALSFTVWLGRTSTDPAQARQQGVEEPVVDPGAITVSKTGPYPEAVVRDSMYDFGQMLVGQTKSHTFEIRNQGAAPLKLGKLKTSCTCSDGELAAYEVPPGGATKVTLSWTPKELKYNFTASATVKTNDPEQRELTFEVLGAVERTIYVVPGGEWNLGDLPEDEPARVSGLLASSFLDDFQIVNVDSSSEFLQAEFTRVDDQELKEHNAKSGYRIDVTLLPGVSIGTFRGTLTVQTDAPQDDEYLIRVRGRRYGPLRFVPTSELKWHAEDLAAGLGRFRASEGAEGSVWVFVNGLDEEFRFESVESDLDTLDVELVKDPQSPQRYRITFRVPPGQPPTSRTRTNPVTVNVTTNHPKVPEIEFTVMFISIK